MKTKLTLGAALAALGLCGALAAAPQAASTAAKPADVDKLVELLRKDVRAQKADIISKTMGLDTTQAAAFWPVYKQYEAERAAIGNDRVAIIQDYAEHYDTLNDAKAKGLLDRQVALEEKLVALQKRYVGEFQKVLPAKTVGRFFQVERRVNMLIDLELSSQIPLIQ